jgi:hypothetical protein
MSKFIDLNVKCNCCREAKTITVSGEDFIRWQEGECIQNAFPYLSPDNREILISGICGPCFDKMFGEEDE